MGIISRMLKEKVVYWPPVGVDSYGKPIYGAPIEMRGRWEDSNDEVMTEDGENVISRGRVFVEQDVQNRGLLFHGTLDQVLDLVNPFNNKDSLGIPLVHRIIKFDKLPDLKIRNYLRTTYIS